MIEKINGEIIADDHLRQIYNSDNFILNKFFNNEELLSLLNHSQILHYEPGEIILSQGDKTKGIYIVLEGVVTVSAKMLGKNKFQLGLRSPGDFLAEISFIGIEPSPTSFIANEKVLCLFISKNYLNMANLLFPEINYKIVKAITTQVCTHLEKIHDKVIEYIANSDMSKLSLYGRVFHSLNKPSIVSKELDEYKQLLTSNFNYFSNDEWDNLFQQCQFLEASKHCKIVFESEKANSCFIIIRGAVQTCIMKDNKLAKLSVIGPFTLLANITNKEKHSFIITFIACENSIILKMNEAHLKYIETNHPLLWYKIFNLICKSMVALQKSVDKLDSRLQIENYNR